MKVKYCCKVAFTLSVFSESEYLPRRSLLMSALNYLSNYCTLNNVNVTGNSSASSIKSKCLSLGTDNPARVV